MNQLQFDSKAAANVVRSRRLLDYLQFRNPVIVEHYREGQKIGQYECLNGITDVGLNSLLDVYFHAVAAITTWYVGLVDNSGWTAFANGDTMGSHAGWTELTSYDEATRVEWTEGAAASRSITNASPLTFTQNATATVKGVFVTSVSTKGGTTGTLWATAAFGTAVPVVDDDALKVTYTVSG